MAATARAVDLTDVSEGGSFKPRRKPEGDYRAKFVKADDHKKEGKEPGWVMTVQIDGDARSTYPVYLNPEKKQAWKIFQACRAAGMNVKNARVRFDPNKLVGKAIGVFLEDEEYEGRPKSVVAEMFPVSEVGANADEDAPDDEDIDTDEVEIPDDQDIEEDEDEEPEPVKPTKRVARKKAAPPPVEEEDEEEDEDDEEEPPPPPRKRTPAAKKAAPVRRRKPAPEPEPEDDDEEDEDLDLDDLDD